MNLEHSACVLNRLLAQTMRLIRPANITFLILNCGEHSCVSLHQADYNISSSIRIEVFKSFISNRTSEQIFLTSAMKIVKQVRIKPVFH